MKISATLLAGCLLLLAASVLPAEDKPPCIKPEESRQYVGMQGEVVFEVKASKNSMNRKTVFLDSTTNFNDEANLGIAISEQGVADLNQKRAVSAPAEYYRGKTIRVVGTVVLEDDRVYIKVDAAEQLDLAKDEPTP